ncbi:nitroreductase family protein [Fretibacterium fastidiosum]|uniref:Nitroreductase n=1 Tax=Fretibacterium fastidiosum TaxID=651822 RepID=A0AB94IW46_9BACT|nr:nitroreductase family protein [Fretibacterium fastidiosum]CBL27939.1 Nitroreductase [Fretibacterium fastidiosum]
MLEAMRRRRSIRKFEGRKVEDGDVTRLMDAGLVAPTGKNTLCTEFFAVTDKAKIERLAQCRDGMAASSLRTAPLAILVAGRHKDSDVWREDASAAAAFVLLEATEMGLGACWVQVFQRPCGSGTSEEAVRRILGIDPEFSILCAIAVGYPAEEKEPRNLETLDRSRAHRL